MSLDHALLNRALDGLDSLRPLGGPPPWTLGGGVALALTWHHRRTLDVDIFMNDAQWLTSLSPRLNDRVAQSSTDYEEGSANLRVIYPEGAVDFVIAPTLTATTPRSLDLARRLVRVDDAGEILAKKIHYRHATFLVRSGECRSVQLHKTKPWGLAPNRLSGPCGCRVWRRAVPSIGGFARGSFLASAVRGGGERSRSSSPPRQAWRRSVPREVAEASLLRPRSRETCAR